MDSVYQCALRFPEVASGVAQILLSYVGSVDAPLSSSVTSDATPSTALTPTSVAVSAPSTSGNGNVGSDEESGGNGAKLQVKTV